MHQLLETQRSSRLPPLNQRILAFPLWIGFPGCGTQLTQYFTKLRISQSNKPCADDLQEINHRRRSHNRLGFAYQLAYVRLFNRFPSQVSFEIVDELLTFVGIQLSIPSSTVQDYITRRETVAEHQQHIRVYLGLRRFRESEIELLERYLFDEACRLEQTNA